MLTTPTRFAARSRGILAMLLLGACVARDLNAQRQPKRLGAKADGDVVPPSSSKKPRDFSGVTTSVSLARFSIGFSDSSQTARAGISLGIGYRRAIPRTPFSITAGGALAVTDITGLDPRSDSYSFSRLDANIMLTAAPSSGRWRLFLAVVPLRRWAVRTAERRAVSDSIVNIRDGGTQRPVTYGIELPLNGRHSAVTLAFTPLSGQFTYRESAGIVTREPTTYRGSQMTLGWSGPAGPIGLPWR